MMTNVQRELLRYCKSSARKGITLLTEDQISDLQMMKIVSGCTDFFQKIFDDIERIEKIEEEWP